MESISDEMPISEARANLTEVVNAVRLQDRCVALTKRGKMQAVIVPSEIGQMIRDLGLETATARLAGQPESAD